MKLKILSAVIGAALTLGMAGASGATLDDVKARGMLKCGVTNGLTGFSSPDDQNNWTGLDVDFCRAVAAAIFGDGQKVEFVPLDATQRFEALKSGEIDILSRNTTWTMSRDTTGSMSFIGVMYYDGQGFMVKKSLGVDSALKLNGASVCTQTGTTTEMNLADYFRANNMTYQVVAYQKSNEVVAAYSEGRCDVTTTDKASLFAQRLNLPDPENHIVLPEIISKEPLGPAVRQNDTQWFNLVRWTYFALLNAEELGVTQANAAEQLASSTNPEVARLLGKEGDFGKGLGLENDWVMKILAATGNYGEIYERNVGETTKLGIQRGVNALWKNGGLQYAPPIR